MRMSHVYQPLLIRTLLQAGGAATVRQLAVEFQRLNEPQVRRMEKRIREMPARVLRNHSVLEVDRDLVRLNVQTLTFRAAHRARATLQRENRLVPRLTWRISLGLRSRGDRPGQGELRYEVLRSANGKCALCGRSKDEEPLEVDHIVPRSRGGANTIENLQALCRTCNGWRRRPVADRRRHAPDRARQVRRRSRSHC
jgi:ATP adenylyltransferase